MVMLAIVYLLGILFCSTGNGVYAFAGTILAFGICFKLVKQGSWKRLIVWSLALLMVFSVSCLRYRHESAKREAYLTQIYDGETISVWGEIYKKEYKNGSYNVYISKSVVDFGKGIVPCNDILVYLSSDDYSIGDILRVDGKFKAFAVASNEGEFDLRQFYLSQKIDMAVKGEKCSVLADGGFSIGSFCYGEWLYETRCALVKSFEAITDEITSGILCSMILGDKTLIDADIKSLYQASGISHILAISGLHISIIGVGLYRLMRKKGVSFLMAQLNAGIIILAYGFMTGNAISTKRAVYMFILVTFANTLGRSYDMLNALGIAVLIILVENPFAIGYAGFVFSVVAIIAIGLVVPVYEERDYTEKTDRKERGTDRNRCRVTDFAGDRVLNIKASLLSGLAIQLTTLPLVSFYYYEIPTYAIFLNMLILPLLNILFLSGLSAALIGLKCRWFARIAVVPAGVILKLYETLCNITMELPQPQIIVGKPSAGKLTLYYAILGTGLIILKTMRQREKGGQMRLIKASLMVFLCLILLSHKKPGFEIDILDVGQGDGIYISTGENYNLFIDGGSTSESKLARYTILPFLKSKGVRKIDYWFISHADQDHISAIEDVLASGYGVDSFVIAQSALCDEAMSSLVDRVEAYGCHVILMNKNDMLDLGESRISCIYPRTDEAEDNDLSQNSTDRNNICLSFIYQDNDFKGIFCGDISGEVENEILDDCDMNLLSNVNLYKVNHHGSKYSSTEEWLGLLKPDLSVISCGDKNMYGHPSDEAIERLEEAGSKIYITKDSGQISIKKKDGLMQVFSFDNRSQKTK